MTSNSDARSSASDRASQKLGDRHKFKYSQSLSKGASTDLCSICGLSINAETHKPPKLPELNDGLHQLLGRNSLDRMQGNSGAHSLKDVEQPKPWEDSGSTPDAHKFTYSKTLSKGASHDICSVCGLSIDAKTHVTGSGTIENPTLPIDRMVKYPFPIRDGCCCFFELPRNITKEEVDRIAHYLISLSVNFQP